MESKNDVPVVEAKNRTEWRNWLTKNHQSENAAWLVIYHKKSDVPSVYYAEAVEEALCFGWIDSKGNKRDAESSYLYFARRKPKSNWSKPNKERVQQMISQGLMTPAGANFITLAKETGTWDALTDIDNLVIPDDLQELFGANKIAFDNFQKFPPSAKRMILEWIMNAKKQETRQKRMEETIQLAAENKRSR